jgi:hypothetical protein
MGWGCMTIEWLRNNVVSREDAEFLFFVAQTIISIVAIAALLSEVARTSWRGTDDDAVEC